jgi:hypothetical protein
MLPLRETGHLVSGVLLVVGAALSLWCRTLIAGSRKGWARLISAILIGVGCCLYGATNLVSIHMSGRSSAAGTLTYLSQYHRSESSFYVQSADGRTIFVHCSYGGDHLIEGETVSVETLDIGSELLHLSVLDGRYAGWTLKEGDGSVGAEFNVALGLIVIFLSKVKRQRDPEDLSEDDLNLPKDGVDSK